jgi:hypothetical protein
MKAGKMAAIIREAGVQDAEVVVSLLHQLGEMEGDEEKMVLSVANVEYFLDIPGN